MLAHEFQDMPQQHELTLRCRWCMKTPAKVREDGCPARELEEIGHILLSRYNPAGVAYFHGRKCVTCNGPIMGHWLRRGSQHYWCYETGHHLDLQFSEGINDCVYDVEGVVVPQELPQKSCQLQ